MIKAFVAQFITWGLEKHKTKLVGLSAGLGSSRVRWAQL